MSTLHVSADPLAAMYSSHHGWLYNWLWRKLGCQHSAADMAQDTFLRTLASPSAAALGQLREPRAYLSTVANGLLVNHWRRLTLERAYLSALAQHPEASAPSPEERALTLETLQRIDAMLDALPPKVRQAFLLAQMDDMPYAQIATELGVSVRMVNKYMSRAMLECVLAMAN